MDHRTSTHWRSAIGVMLALTGIAAAATADTQSGGGGHASSSTHALYGVLGPFGHAATMSSTGYRSRGGLLNGATTGQTQAGAVHDIAVTVEPVGTGTASCDPNPVADGGASSCSPSANAGFEFTGWSGACTGTSCVLNTVTADVSVTAHFRSTSARLIQPLPTLAEGVSADLDVDGCAEIDRAVFVQPPADAVGMTFPFGLLELDLGQCGPQATVTVTYSAPIPAGAVFYKRIDEVYVPYPHSAGMYSVTFLLTDGGAGDHDGEVNGVIRDPAGFGVDSEPVPLSVWPLSLLAFVLAWPAMRRRAVRLDGY